jgi:TRAP-type C4-dicarboxylate transport system substrate-binding protein
MSGRFLPLVVTAAIVTLIPGSSELGRAQTTQTIKIAMLAPRGSAAHIGFQKLGERIAKDTHNAWQVRVYASGVAGDEKDVIRKMRVQQLDGAVISNEGLSVIEPQVAIFDAPGLFNSYAQLEAVQKDIEKDFEQLFLKKGIRVLAWWEVGQYRIFSKGKIQHVADLKKHREWLWPDNYVLKEMWKEAGASGVPLGTPDVFGALQTGMIDTVIASPIALVSMRWHTNLDHVTARPNGVLLLEWILNSSKWDAMPEKVKAEILKELPPTRVRVTKDSRESDADAYKKLLERGYTATAMPEKEWDDYFARVCNRLTGRVWPRPLYARIKAIVDKTK